MNKVDICVWEQNKRTCFSLFKRVESYVTVKGVKCLNPTRGNLLFGYSAPTFMMGVYKLKQTVCLYVLFWKSPCCHVRTII